MQPLPFIPEHYYHRRTEIHGPFQGNQQRGISYSPSSPFVFIFTGKSGHQHGYRDGWDNPSIFSYTGEGQSGDMQFREGNKALRDHIEYGKRVLLFESGERRGYAKFICEVELFDVDTFETHDTDGHARTAIKFFFKKTGASLAIDRSQLLLPEVSEPQVMYTTAAHPLVTTRQSLVTTRVGQDAYRKGIIHRWQYQCAVTGFNDLQLLIASHIFPWANSSDDERLDVHNGILLSPTYDALFDRHLITFENSGEIVLSDSITREAFSKIGVTGKEKITHLSHENRPYLEKHRATFSS